MKKHFLWLLIAAFTVSLIAPQIASAQIFDKGARKAKKAAKQEKQDGWDIVLDPIERDPDNKISRRDVLDPNNITNWGSTLLLTQDLKERISKECTNPVRIKIMDTAGRWGHSDLQRGQVTGKNYTSSPGLDDMQGHSTHVAGIIFAQFGIAFPLVEKGLLTAYPLKVLGDNGSGSFSWIAGAATDQYADDKAAAEKGIATIYNLSLGGGTAKVPEIESAFKRSTDIGGVVFVCAAGNTGVTGVNYPGNSDYSIAVASLDKGLTVSSYSTRGPEVWAAMPGRAINSTYRDGYAELSGTSMATPFQTAALSIAFSKWGIKNLNTVARVKAYLKAVASDLPPTGKDNDTGWGIDYLRAILDKDPATVKTGNPPTDPPTDPPINPPTDPVRELRTLTIPVTGALKMVWGSTIGQPAAKNAEPALLKLSKAKLKAAGATNTLTVTSVTADFDFAGNAVKLHDSAKADIENFFKGRGLVLQPNNDFADACYWTSYFLDMHLTKDKAYKLTVQNIQAKDETGRVIVWDKARLKHWQ